MPNFLDKGIGNTTRDLHAIDRPTGQPNHQMHGMHVGVVADDIDEMGHQRVHVYIPGVSAFNPNISYSRLTPTREPAGKDGKPGKVKPEMRRGFILAHPMTPFSGSDKTRETKQSDGRDPQTGQSNSYGFMSQPRNGDMVMIAFAGGDPSKCYYLGCVPKTGENDMIPGHKPAETNASGAGVSTKVGPKVNKGPKDKETLPSKVLFDNLTDSGLIQDPLRGLGSSSATRESPSRVMGMKTPGDPDTNMQGHQFVLDDHPDSQLIRLRTSKGAQLLLSDTGDFIYASTRSGKSWIEIDDAGNCFVYAHSSISMHTEEDFNMTCDRDFNLHVGGNLNAVVTGDTRWRMNKGGNITVGEGGGDLDITAIHNIHLKVQEEFRVGAKTGITLKSADFLELQSAKDMKIKSAQKLNAQTTGDLNFKIGGKINQKASGDFNVDSGGIINATNGSLSIADVADGQDPNQADIPITHSVAGPPQTSGPPKSPNSMIKAATAIMPQHEPWMGHRAQHPGHDAAIAPESIPKMLT